MGGYGWRDRRVERRWVWASRLPQGVWRRPQPTVGAAGLDRARLTGRGGRLIGARPGGVLVAAEAQLRALRAGVRIAPGVVGERLRAEHARPLARLGQGHVGADALVFQDAD